MPEITSAPATLPELQLLVENRQKLVAMKKEIEKQIEDATSTIKDDMIERNVMELEVGDYKLTLQLRDRSTLDKTELVSMGVSTDVIKKATKTSTYTQLDVREKK